MTRRLLALALAAACAWSLGCAQLGAGARRRGCILARGELPERIALVTARGGEDVAALCERAGSGWSSTPTAAFNGPEIGHRFSGGEQMKVARVAAG